MSSALSLVAPDDGTSFAEEPISPELVLVSPEFRQWAIVALPPFELDRRAPIPAAADRPAVAARSTGGVLRGVTIVGILSFVGCSAIVLVLTAIADALR